VFSDMSVRRTLPIPVTRVIKRMTLFFVRTSVLWCTINGKNSPKTILFFVSQDPLIPYAQALLLDEALDDAGEVNKFLAYSGGHEDWKTRCTPYVEESCQVLYINCDLIFHLQSRTKLISISYFFSS